MYEAPIRFSSDSGSDCYGSRSSDGRFRTHRSLLRDREHPTRRYLLYLGLLAGFCTLLVAGCGSITPIGELKATESTVSFGAVTVGQTSSATVTFMNGGASAVQITQVTVTGQPFKLASVGSFPVTVAAGSTYSVPVLFKPSSAGEATGQLTLTSTADAGGLPMATLNGLGVQGASPPGQTAGVLSGISCSNSSMTGAGTDSCFVALNAPAGSSGVTELSRTLLRTW